MTTPQQPGWYDDPHDPNAQRYWDGEDWTPHRQRKPISRPTQPPSPQPVIPTQPPPPPPASPPPPPSGVEYPPPPSGVEYPPPPSGVEYPPPPSGGPPHRSGTPMIAVIGVIAVLAVAGVLVYKFVLTHHSSSAPTDSAPGASTYSAPGAPTHSAPGASTNGGESTFLSDLATVGITSSTAKPEALVAKGRKACSGLAGGESQDEVAADLVSASNHFFDESSADKIVRFAIKDLCPQQR